jgi:hypothetical protein
MSAYIVAPEHVGALAAYAASQQYPNIHEALKGQTKKETAANIAQCLMKANIESVAERYPDDKDGERPGPAGYTDRKLVIASVKAAYHYLVHAPVKIDKEAGYKLPLKAIDIIKMCGCFDYQACEVDNYEETIAANQVNRIRRDAIQHLHGYEEAVRDYYDESLH